MIFRARPVRTSPPGSPRAGLRPWGGSGEPSAFGEAALDRLRESENASNARMSLPRDGGSVSGVEPAGVQPMARSGGNGSDGGTEGGKDRKQSGLSRPDSAKSDPEDAPKPQPSADDGVPEDMATLVLDKAALGQGPIAGPDREAERLAVDRHFAAADPASDAAIMLRVAAGDESGFNYLVEKYHRAMIHFLFRMVHNQAVAEELAQEVFLRVYRSRESYRAEAKFTTWLYRIATNLAVNHAR